MNKKEIIIIQQGDSAQFRVTNSRPDFDMQSMDFHLELLYGMKGKYVSIPKSECAIETRDQCSFTFDSSDMVGYVVARFVCEVYDETVGTRQEVDEQMLCFVATEPCIRLSPCIGCEDRDHDVSYEYVPFGHESSVYVILCDVNGNFLRDVDGLVLRGLKENTNN